MSDLRGASAGDRLRAWLVTGPLGRGASFALDFGRGLRMMISGRLR